MTFDFNPVQYTLQARIVGYGLVVLGILMLVLIAMIATRSRYVSKMPPEDSRD